MTVAKQLKKEFENAPQGTFAPYYYKYLGYRENFAADKTEARASAIYALFSRAPAYVYRNDLVAGSLRSAWSAADAAELNYAASVVGSFGDRTFGHNADHFSPDYRAFLKKGIGGVLADIERSESAHAGDAEGLKFLAAAKKSMLGFRELVLSYARAAEENAQKEGYDAERMTELAHSLRRVAEGAPETFRDALQLVWLTYIAFRLEGRAAMALGRMDQYLLPYYEKDRADGRITRQSATELLENAFMKIYENQAYLGGDDVVNICIGGTSPDGSSDIGELSYCVLDAVGNCGVPGPNLSARIPRGVPDEFLDACLKVIGTGLGYPALMNDEVNLAALSKFGYEREDVYDYSMVGCIENFITGKQPPWSDGRFDTPRFFEFLFNRGRAIASDKMGIDTGDVSEIKDMAEFMRRFEAQLRYGADEYFMYFNNENTRLNPAEYVQPFLSCFCDDCIGRARDVNMGGAKYPSVHGAALMGVGTVCDSLAAVEKVVFEDKAATLSEIGDALRADFDGYEDLREKLLAAPKYGNNDGYADKYAVWFVDYLSDLFSRYRTHDGGWVYVAMAANVSNIYAGRVIAATPDGRRKGEPLSDAASPTYGRDKLGATATVLSVTKPDYTKVACGTVVNQKFSPAMFGEEKRKKLVALLKVYFEKGGQELQINATSREVLADAMAHPENYRDLVVRVSGFSALFVALERDVQLDILHRTQQS